jgi:outer membrane protein assembly factor BamB
MTVTKLWETPISQERYYATPLFDNGLLYLVNQRAGGTLTVLEAASGAKVYEQGLNLGGVTYPSPVLAGNVVIIGAESGKTVVVASGREYKELGRPVMPPYRATPLPDGKYLYLRTCNDKGSKLFCIGE